MTLSVESIERQLRLHGVPANKARSVALQQHGVFVAPVPPRRVSAPKLPIDIPASDPDNGRYEFLLPLPDPQTNGSFSRAHWSKKTRARSSYYALCNVAAILPPHPIKPLAHGWLTIRFHLARTMDLDGLSARAKWPIDFLVSHGWLVDDNPTCLTWAGLPTQSVSQRREYGVHLTLQSVAP